MKSILLLRKMKLKDDLKLMGIMTVITLIMIGVFSSFNYSSPISKFAIIDEDQSELSQSIINSLNEIEDFDFQIMSLEAAKKAVKNEDVLGALYMKEDFMMGVLQGSGRVGRLLIQEDMNLVTMNNLFQSTLDRILQDQMFIDTITSYLRSQGVEDKDVEAYTQELLDTYHKGEAPFTSITRSFKEEDVYSPIKQSVIGFSLFFAMFTVIFGVSDILMEKEQFTWHRQMIAPISKLSILAGHMTFVFLLGFSQVSAMFIVSKYLFKVQWVGNMLLLLVVIAAFVYAVASMGMFLSNFVKSMGQLSAVSPIIITGSAMLGGCFWPLEIVTSKPLLFLSLLTPQRWAIQGIKSVIIYGEGFSEISFSVLILLGMGTLYLLIGAWLLNRKAI